MDIEGDDSLVKEEGEGEEYSSYTDSYRKENRSSSDYAEYRNTKNTGNGVGTRSEGEERSEGSSAHSPRSTPRRRSVGGLGGIDEDITVDDNGDNGVSPPTTPLSHHHHMTQPSLFNPLFANNAAIQLGLAASTAMPSLGHHLTPRFSADKGTDSERLQPPLIGSTAQKEISQQ